MNATIGHFVDIGKTCFIGSGTHVTKKLNLIVLLLIQTAKN